MTPQHIYRCMGVREPHSADPAPWITPCVRCIRRADKVGDGPWAYASAPVTRDHGEWFCAARMEDHYEAPSV